MVYIYLALCLLFLASMSKEKEFTYRCLMAAMLISLINGSFHIYHHGLRDYSREANKARVKCEENLPRNQSCIVKVIAVPESEYNFLTD